MPGINGIEFLKQVRAMDKTIPFILFTGKGREEIAIEAFENGADGYIQKGGEPKSQFAVLINKMNMVVSRRQSKQQLIISNQLYAVLSASNKTIVRIHDKKELLKEICRIVVDTGGFTMAWAGIANPKTHCIEPVATSGHVDKYLDNVIISTDNVPEGRGPTGTAFRTKTICVCNDIEHDPIMAPWRKDALDRGYYSVAAFPFALDTSNAGVITFYSSEPGFFNDRIIRLLEEQAEDITFGLVNLDHEELRTTAKRDLETSDLQYRRLFESARDAILILDGDTGEISDANAFVLDMLGYPLEYCIGKHLWELGFIADKSLAKNAFDELKTKGYIRYDNLPLKTKQDRELSVEFTCNAFLVANKKVFQCNIRNITQRKAFLDALQASETRYRRLFETAQDGILILNAESGEIIDANKFILEMLGFPFEYFVGKHLWEIGFIKDKSFAQEAFAALKKNSYVRYEDIPLETKDGQSIDVEFVSNVYPVNHHQIIQCNIRNITDRKRAEDALALASKKLNLLSSITRHDINNQLLSLSAYQELSKEVLNDPTAISGYIAKEECITATIGRQIAFTKEYEDLGVRTPVWQRLSEIIRLAESEIADNTIALEIPDDRLEIYADSLLIKVFFNLFDNSRQHGGGVTRITISHHICGAGLIVAVADNGKGISAEDKPHVFERGFGKGSGLGLFLTREILSITGISISETGVPGTGACFEIAVPEGAFRFTD